MGTITAGIGLVSGINYQQLTDELVQAPSGPVNNQTALNTQYSNQQTAITSLEATMLALQFATNNLSNSSLYTQRTVTSSDPNTISATVTGTPQTGQYQLTSVQLAQSQQFQSSKFASATSSIGAGTLTLGQGGFVDPGASLDLLNGGEGFSRGEIQITDRSGASATVDLRFASSIDDVLSAINGAGIGVQASVQGDKLVLTDTTGKTTSDLKVQEVGGGSTAASLGLSGIDVAANSATGSDVLQLFSDVPLNLLNDGNGVNFNNFLPDLQINFRDGTSTTVDFHQLNASSQEQTLGDVVNTLNNAAPGKLHAAINSNGDGLVLSDLTTDSGSTFSVSALNGSKAAYDLGLTSAASGGTITGGRLLAGLQTVLLSSLNGGAGVGQLGSINITDRSGASAVVDLSSAQTVDDVVTAINQAGIGVKAQVNAAGDGIEIDDTTGQTSHNLTIANADGTDSADKLKLTVDAATSSQNSGSLNLQTVSESTLLSSLNGGAGVGTGSIKITDSNGHNSILKIGSTIQTVGDLIQSINVLNLGVTAQINSTGDGIALVDTAHGPGTLSVSSVSGTSANDLHLLGAVQTVNIAGTPTQEINGSTSLTINVSSTDTLTDLVDKINAANYGVQAAITNDGSAVKPYRLTLFNSQSGKAASLVADTSGLNFSLQQTVAGQNAVAVLGSPNSASSALATSATNTFTSLLPGLSVTLSNTSATPVTVSVGATNSNLATALQSVVDAYNKVHSQIETDTSFDSTSNTGAVLQGDPSLLEVDNELGNLIAGDIPNGTSIRSLAQLGIIVGQDGTLQFNQTQFQTVYTQDPQGVQDFLSAKNTGVSDQFKTLINSLATDDTSVLAQRVTTLAQKLDDGQSRLADLNSHLDSLRQRLLTQFANSELAIAKIQSNVAAINSIQPFLFAGSTSSNSAAKQVSTANITGG